LFLLDGTVVHSASDLTRAVECEFALVRSLDAKLGRCAPPPEDDDPMRAYTARLGDQHEERVLEQLVQQYGLDAGSVAEIDSPRTNSQDSLRRAHRQTVEAMRAGAGIVYQGAFFDGRFHGRADFLVREVGVDGRPHYVVHDAKLARRAKVSALLQLAAYAHQLHLAEIPTASDVRLILGDGSITTHRLADLLPVYLERRGHLEEMFDARSAPDAEAVAWNDPRYTACGKCVICQQEVDTHRDLFQVARLRRTQRARLQAAGISTIDQLAASTDDVEGVPDRTLETLRAQARLQVGQSPPGAATDSGTVDDGGVVTHEVFATEALAALPAPDPGDVFFDFEGDPLWSAAGGQEWGLEYLFGIVELSAGQPTYRHWWAEDREQEKQALLDFLAYIERRRIAHPGMHIYHYAAYERTALLRLAGRHGVGEEHVDQLLRQGVLVDLYATVRGSIRVSQPSYSIKKLEPLYQVDHTRESDVTGGGESVVAFDTYLGLLEGDQHERAGELKRSILEYNDDDCRSTLHLRDWLLERAAERGIEVGRADPEQEAFGTEDAADDDEAELTERMLQAAGPTAERDPDQQALAMVAATLGYHRREDKPFWWSHFDRLVSPVDEWTDTRDVMQVGEATVLEGWHRPPNKRNDRRRLRLVGILEPGSSIGAEAKVSCLYEPVQPWMKKSERGTRGWTEGAKVLTHRLCADGHDDVIELEDMLGKDQAPHDELPMALVPPPGPRTASIQQALRSFAEGVVDGLPELPDGAGMDLLRRRSPRARPGETLPPIGPDGDAIAPLTEALRGLEESYLAVQGPPGTGKTYVGSHVIARLVQEDRWRVGVVAQSHAVVQNMLTAVLEAGVSPSAMAKKPKNGDTDEHPWASLTKDADFASFVDPHAETGRVLGGTAWDFTNRGRVALGALDLLVVDEAGQYSLANTLAVSTAARRLLLLGDPQQLPQVSQGAHPEPVDGSALGWLAEGHAALPADRGYFLDRSWRMHSQLSAAVSRLAYEDQLASKTDRTDVRELVGVEPGMHVVNLGHEGHAVVSVEEAAEVVRQTQGVLGQTWRDPRATVTERDLGQQDVLVVAPYNAQVAEIRTQLADAGLAQVRVGTVDGFQGQQAPVVIVSMTASSAEDVPRGMDFLLSRNRLNVAVSRGQWCAIIVRSTRLTDYLPATPTGLAELGAFVGLCNS